MQLVGQRIYQIIWRQFIQNYKGGRGGKFLEKLCCCVGGGGGGGVKQDKLVLSTELIM